MTWKLGVGLGFAILLVVVWLFGPTGPETVFVSNVVDGDTIEVVRENGTKDTVRLLGVDTPETKHPNKPVECMGLEASAFTRERLLGKRVRLVEDLEVRDKYDRLLAHILIDGSPFGTVLVEKGYASVLIIEPNKMYGRELVQAQLKAKKAGIGIWGKC